MVGNFELLSAMLACMGLLKEHTLMCGMEYIVIYLHTTASVDDNSNPVLLDLHIEKLDYNASVK